MTPTVGDLIINLDHVAALVERAGAVLHMAEKISLGELVDPPNPDDWEKELEGLRHSVIDCQKILVALDRLNIEIPDDLLSH